MQTEASIHRNGNLLLWLILAIACYLRLHHLTGFSLSNDELSALARLRYDSWSELIRLGVMTDYHPAGVQVFLYYWTKLFGNSEFVVRLPFALLGTGSVYLIYLVGNRWFGRTTGLLAAAALATLEFPLLYSQIARPYSPGLFFTLLATLAWTRCLFPEKNGENPRSVKFIDYAIFTLAVSACMYVHYFSFISAGILCAAGLFFLRRDNVLPYLLSGVAIVLLYIPHLQIFLHQLAKGGVGGAEGWLGPPEKDAFANYINYAFNNSLKLKGLYLVLSAGCLWLYRKEIRWSWFQLLALLFFAIPFAVAYYYSIWKNPVFQHSVLLFSFPFLLLFLFSFVPRSLSGFTASFFVLILTVGSLYATGTEADYYHKKHFSEFRAIAHRIHSLNANPGDAAMVKTIHVFDPYYLNYYLFQSGDSSGFDLDGLMKPGDRLRYCALAAEDPRPFFMHAWSNVYAEPWVDLVARCRYPWVAEQDTFLNSGLTLYAMHPSDSSRNRLPDQQVLNSFETNAWGREAAFADTMVVRTGNTGLHIGPDQDYSPGYSLEIGKSGMVAGTVLDVFIYIRSDKMGIQPKLVCTVDRGEKSLVWGGASAADFIFRENTFCPLVVRVTLPDGLDPADVLKVYLWNEKHEDFYVDDFRMDVYLPR